MTLNYSFLGEWSASTKDLVGKWVKQKLTLVQDGEAPEDLFLEYIIVMIGNGKKMQELSHELQDFIGEQKAIDFASDLGVFLQSMSPPVVATQSIAVPQAQVSKEPIVVPKPSKDILDGGLQSSRSSSGGVTQKNNSRLLDSALRSTNTTLSQKRVAPERSSSQSIGLTSPSSQQNPVVSNSAGLFTKRGSSNSTNNNSHQPSEGLGVVKKRKVIVEGNNITNGLQIQPSFSEAQAMRNAAQAEAMQRGGGEFRPPAPYGHFQVPNFAPAPIDPKFAYMEQMNMMAHMSGFGSAEEMLFFQQSMMANMMGGGMNMPGMHMAGRGPTSSSAEHYPQQQQQRHRGGGFMAGRGRGFDGRGQPRDQTGQFHQGSGATQRTVPPPPPPPRDQMPSKVAVEEGAKGNIKVEGAEVAEGTEDPSAGSFGYSGGATRGGYRGRGRGRGRGFGRGDFQSSAEFEAGGRGSSEFAGSGGRFAYASRGRGAYRGRGSAAPTAEGGPPASFNKVWVREADIEGPLVAGR